MSYKGTFGVQYAIHNAVWEDLTAPELVRLAEATAAGDLQYLWFDDALAGRHTFSAMAAMASRVPLGYGVMVTYPWGQNPIERASALATIAELMPQDRELMLGISTGGSTRRYVDRPHPGPMVHETIELSRRLLEGEEVKFGDYAGLAGYFHLKEAATLRFSFSAQGRVSFWVPPSGPPTMRAAAEAADGIVLGAGTQVGFEAMRDGTLERQLEEAEELRRKAGNGRPLRRILDARTSVGRDRTEALARAHLHASAAAKRAGTHLAAQLGYRQGQTEPEFTEAELERMFLVGTPEQVAERLLDCMDVADQLGCEHIMLGVPAGPHPMETAELVGQVLVPLVKGWRGGD